MSRRFSGLVVCLGVTASLSVTGCSSRPDIEQVPIGTRVEVTRQDGGVVRGTLTARDTRAVQMSVGPSSKSIPREEIASIELANGKTPPVLPAVAKFREITIPEGTALAATLDSAIGSDTSQVEDPVAATLTESVLVDGVEVLPAGSVLTGVVTTAAPSAKVKGRASLAVRFRSILVRGSEKYALSSSLNRTAASTRVEDAKKIGIPAAGGAVVGAIIGGKKGAAIGAAAGGGAGAAVVLATPGDEVRLPRGTVVSIALDEAIDVRVPIEDASRR